MELNISLNINYKLLWAHLVNLIPDTMYLITLMHKVE